MRFWFFNVDLTFKICKNITTTFDICRNTDISVNRNHYNVFAKFKFKIYKNATTFRTYKDTVVKNRKHQCVNLWKSDYFFFLRLSISSLNAFPPAISISLYLGASASILACHSRTLLYLLKSNSTIWKKKTIQVYKREAFLLHGLAVIRIHAHLFCRWIDDMLRRDQFPTL